MYVVLFVFFLVFFLFSCVLYTGGSPLPSILFFTGYLALPLSFALSLSLPSLCYTHCGWCEAEFHILEVKSPTCTIPHIPYQCCVVVFP
uniref:Putative secreted peptide n=1 Tax=Anopheles braziliensis TaxID=58242 RepID=A0A2M3ZRT1_9DIPT